MANQFIDKFKFLTTEDAKITSLRTRVTQVLNSLLPSRVLSKANIFNLTLDLSQDFTNMMMFYTEDSLNEANLHVAQRESSIRGLAALPGHQATRAISSRGVIRCTLKPGVQLLSPKLVLSDVIATCETNKLQYTAKISAGIREVSTSVQAFDIELIEGKMKTVKFVADGSPLFRVELDDTGAIENYDINVTVNSDTYSKVDNLYAMGVNDKSYYAKNGYGNQVDLIFGDGIHGTKLEEGDVILVEYRVTNGELGNVDDTAKFTLTTGIYDVTGSQIDIGEYMSVDVQSGFKLGSNGEDIELTRSLAGYHSRAHVFLKPENLKAYLSRLTILSQVDVWTEYDDLIFNMMLLPNLAQKLARYSDYLYINDDNFKLTDGVKSDIRSMINASRRQATSEEIVIHDPVFRKYAIFIYVDATVNDKDELRNEIEDKVSAIMLEQTFAETKMNTKPIVSRSAIVDALYDMNEIKNISIDIISETNEIARINGYHDYTVEEIVASTKTKRIERREVPADKNPNIGFSDLGDLVTENRTEIPVLRGGFKRYVDASTTVDISKPVYIYYKTANNTWDEL